MKIFIVEDEDLHLETAIMNIQKAGFELAGFCKNADVAFDEIVKTKPDVVLVDIALPGILNGITLSEKINKELGIPHIFTTSFTENEVIKQAVATKPSGYLKKPIELTNLKAAIEIAKIGKKSLKDSSDELKTETRLLFTKIGDRLVKIPIDEIFYIKADGENYTAIFLDKKELFCRITIKQLLTELPKNFIQIHRSIVINTSFLDEINEQNQVAIIKGKELAIGRKYKKLLLSTFNRI